MSIRLFGKCLCGSCRPLGQRRSIFSTPTLARGARSRFAQVLRLAFGDCTDSSAIWCEVPVYVTYGDTITIYWEPRPTYRNSCSAVSERHSAPFAMLCSIPAKRNAFNVTKAWHRERFMSITSSPGPNTPSILATTLFSRTARATLPSQTTLRQSNIWRSGLSVISRLYADA